MSNKTLNTLLGLTAIVFWSTTIGLSRSLIEKIGPLTSASLIFLFGGAFGCAYLLIRGQFINKLKNLSKYYLFGCGCLFAFYEFCLYIALGLASSRSQVLEVSLLNYLWPALTLILSIPILKMKSSFLLVPGCFLAFLGAFLAIMQNQPFSFHALLLNLINNYPPYILGLIAAISWGLYSTLSRKWAGHAEKGAVSLFMLSTGIMLGFLRYVVGEESTWTFRTFIELIYMAIFPSLAYVFWESAMRKGDIILVASFSYLTPLLSTMVTCLYLNIHAGLKLWVGCILVIGGAMLCKFSLRE
jgi:drug/metabolite transporter (DMT)-like permease